jgi:hypothetical protein
MSSSDYRSEPYPTYFLLNETEQNWLTKKPIVIGMVMHAYNPSYLKVKAGGSPI